MSGFTHVNVPSAGQPGMATIKFNDVIVAILRGESGTLDAPNSEYQKFIIPPFTTILITVDGDSSSSDYQAGVNIVARVREYPKVRN